MSDVLTFSRPNSGLDNRKSFGKLPAVIDIPNLIQVQLNSLRWFLEEGLKELFQEISPIKDFTGNRLELHFIGYEFRQPSHTVEQCRERDMTYTAPLYVKAQLLVKETGEIREQEIFFGDLPLMTEKGTFVVSGAEGVVVNQLLRSPGVYFSVQEDNTSGRELCTGKLIPEHGAWLEFETSGRDVIYVKVNGKRKIPVVILLRAIGFDSDEELYALFEDVDKKDAEHAYIRSTIDKEPGVKTKTDAMIDIYKRLRPGDPANPENAQLLINNLFFNPRRYDLGKVGRYKLNSRLGLGISEQCRALSRDDFIAIVKTIIRINNGIEEPDDIDHLRNRRIRTAGHLIQNQFRIGLLRLERTVKERMSIIGPEEATPATLVNNRPIVAAMREFFGGSQLSQFMDQTNPLSELTHKRRLSAMGPGGLSRERAGFDVRDVHHSHYGKICPIETPEGPNIGLIGSLATYASVDTLGFIETPYRRVKHSMPNKSRELLGRKVIEDVFDKKGDVLIISRGTVITEQLLEKLAALPTKRIKVLPFASNEIDYMNADKEEEYTIAQANAILNERNEFTEDKVGVIRGGKYSRDPAENIDYMDVSPKQVFSITTSLIPFLEHDDANRALMGSNMQRQAVPLLRPESPVIATGMEKEVAKYSGQVVYARESGTVECVDSTSVKVKETDGTQRIYQLMKFVRTNQGTCINQRPIVSKGDNIRRGQVIADGSATEQGELALGQNIFCAFMSWRGYNFEDAIILSERLVKTNKFTSIHIEKYEIEARETKLGIEDITRDIPNVGEESLRDLDEHGIIRIGAEVGPGSILVGKISPKGETELTAEEKLLRAIFGEKAREVKDSSLRVPHGESGKVIDVRISTRETDDLSVGVYQLVRVWVAQKRKITVGDKMAGRHGNKGVISRILPEEDMPFLPDGRPVDIILNPIGVPSRMNIGQILETHLGWAAETLGIKVLNPIFDGADRLAIEDALGRAWVIRQSAGVGIGVDGVPEFVDFERAKTWLHEGGFDSVKFFDDRYHGEARRVCLRLWLTGLGINSRDLSDAEVEDVMEKVQQEQRLSPPIYGKSILRDGITGEEFDQPITVGSIYMLKLIHLVEDKVHARSTGPYSLITQQPLGGKAQFGGQRFGEMEVWALEAYGASHMLQELLTVKSDDVSGRAKAYESLVKGEDVIQPGVPESFKVLFMELRSLGLAVELLSDEEEMISFLEERKKVGFKSKLLR